MSLPTNMNKDHPIIVAIDGPAGAGKSTVAKALAKELKYAFLDTGAMYRALTFKAMQSGINLEDEDQLVSLTDHTSIDFDSQSGGSKILLDGQDVSQEIRTLEVTNNTFYIARAPRVRDVMVAWQRKIACHHNVVTEGRDVTTVVFPQTQYKFYLDADIEERARRRTMEFQEKGKDVTQEQVKMELQARDHKDKSRSAGPLKVAEDAIVIDSTQMSIHDVVQDILKRIKMRTSSKKS